MGQISSPDDVSLVLRGIRTLGYPTCCSWTKCNDRSSVVTESSRGEKVYFPGLEDHPRHDLFKRDCKGLNGLLTIELKISVYPEKC
nr:PLP-dependent transferase [Escherichia coli]